MKDTSLRFHRIAVCVALALAISTAAAAGKAECPGALTAPEQAACENTALTRIEATLADSYRVLQAECGALATRLRGWQPAHAAWLAGTRAAFNAQLGVAMQTYLQAAYSRRADLLSDLQAQCDRLRPEGTSVKVHALRFTRGGAMFVLPYVQTRPTSVGRRINDSLYRQVLQSAPPPGADAKTSQRWFEELISRHSAGQELPDQTQFRVVHRDARLLVLGVENSGCATRCWNNDIQLYFDLRTGQSLHPDDLLTAAGREALIAKNVGEVMRQARRIVARYRAGWSEQDRTDFERCITDWRR